MSIAPNIIKFPSLEERNLTKQHYLEEKRFPGIIGKTKNVIGNISFVAF